MRVPDALKPYASVVTVDEVATFNSLARRARTLERMIEQRKSVLHEGERMIAALRERMSQQQTA